MAREAFVEGDADAPPEGPYGRISVLSAFNLLLDKAAAAQAWRGVSKNGARLVLTDAFRVCGPSAADAGPLGDPAFAALLRRTGWRAVHREDLTPLVRRLHERKTWPWDEYMRPDLRHLPHALVSAQDAPRPG